MTFSRTYNRRPWAAAAIAEAGADKAPGRHPNGSTGIFRYGSMQMGELRGTWRDDPGVWEFASGEQRTDAELRNQGWRLVKVEPAAGEPA